MSRERGRAVSGFTLIEVVVFLAVASVALVSLFSIQRLVLSQAYRPALLAQATLLAQGRLEEVSYQRKRGGGYAEVCGLQGTTQWERLELQTAIADGALNPLDNNIACGSPCTVGQFPDYLCVTVTVRHRDTDETLAVIKTLVANY